MVYELEFSIGNTNCMLADIQPFNTPAKREKKYYEHCHPCFEFHYIEAGKATFLCAKKPITISENQILIIPPRTYHKEISSDDGNIKMTVSVDISPCFDTAADSHFYSVFHKSEAFCFTANSSIKKEILKIKKLAADNDKSHTVQEKLRAHTHLLMVELYDELSNTSPRRENLFKDTELSREYEIDTYLAINFMSNSSKDDLAKKLHVSTRQLQRIMKKIYGKGFREKLLELRLEIALGFLTSTDKSITDISEEMGYVNVESFSIFIKRLTGKTPRQIRNEKNK